MYMHVLQYWVFNNELLHAHVNELQSLRKIHATIQARTCTVYQFFQCARIFRNVHDSIKVVKTEIV